MNSLKEFFTYITNQFKFWYIIKEWELGLHLRNGRVIKERREGIYFKVPFLDNVYSQPKRLQDIIVSQINITSKDNKPITMSAAAFFKITNIREYYNGYAEPNSIIANKINKQLVHEVSKINYNDLISEIQELEEKIKNQLKEEFVIKGIELESINTSTFSNARTYRIIKDNLYSQNKNELDNQLF